MNSGLLISFEGPDGGGKTTQIAQLAAEIRKWGLVTLETREPGGTEIGNKIRDVVHDMKNDGITHRTELLLYQASRAQHVEEKIIPALERGEIVLTDRYSESSEAYQGGGRGIDIEQVRWLNDFATRGLAPDMTFLIMVDPEIGIKRRKVTKGLGQEWNRMDNQAMEFHVRVTEKYLQMIKENNTDRWIVIDGNKSIEMVHNEIVKATQDRFRMRGLIENDIRGERQR